MEFSQFISIFDKSVPGIGIHILFQRRKEALKPLLLKIELQLEYCVQCKNQIKFIFMNIVCF